MAGNILIIAVHTIDQSGNATTSYLHYDELGSVDEARGEIGSKRNWVRANI